MSTTFDMHSVSEYRGAAEIMRIMVMRKVRE